MASMGNAEARGKEVPTKRIVICADGTWNDPEDEHPTNVLRVARAISPQDGNGVQQVVFYDWGVGSYYARIRGGVAGLGLKKNIQDCYRFIVQNYDEGDELFLFGFSRGAYTVRALAGFLNKCGILGRDRADQIPEAFRYYKRRRFKPGSEEAEEWRRRHGVEGRGEVAFLGVWDTVGALGVPTRVLAFVDEPDLFYDDVLGSSVRVARHAVAIDEKRKDFEPTLWKPNVDAAARADVKQVWFAGVHADVGGGARPKGGKLLSDVPLAWMATEAANSGLALETHLHGDTNDLHTAERHRSYKTYWRARGKEARKVPAGARVHESVWRRHQETGYAEGATRLGAAALPQQVLRKLRGGEAVRRSAAGQRDPFAGLADAPRRFTRMREGGRPTPAPRTREGPPSDSRDSKGSGRSRPRSSRPGE